MGHVTIKLCCMLASIKGADQPAHSRCLISAFIIHFLSIIMSRVRIDVEQGMHLQVK